MQRRKSNRPFRRGMTLVELVVAAAMLAMVVTAILSFVVQGAQQLNVVSQIVREGHEGPSIMAILERDFLNAYVDERLEHFFEATKDGNSTEVRFVTSRNSQLFLNGVQSDITEVGYRVEANRDRDSTAQTYTLYRREDYSLDDLPLEGGLWIPDR